VVPASFAVSFPFFETVTIFLSFDLNETDFFAAAGFTVTFKVFVVPFVI
jgi:hypothetical protein